MTISLSHKTSGSRRAGRHRCTSRSVPVSRPVATSPSRASQPSSDYAEIKDRLSVGGELALLERLKWTAHSPSLALAFLGNSLEVAANISTGGDMQHAGLISVGGFVSMDGSLSVGDIVVMDKSLSVASMVTTPELGDNHFVFNQPITQDLNAITLRTSFPIPTPFLWTRTLVTSDSRPDHHHQRHLHLLTHQCQRPHHWHRTNQRIQALRGRQPQQRPTQVHDRARGRQRRIRMGDGSATVVHNNISTPGLTGGKRAPTLSVGGRIIVLEDLSVGFDTTIQGGLSVSGAIRAAASPSLASSPPLSPLKHSL